MTLTTPCFLPIYISLTRVQCKGKNLKEFMFGDENGMACKRMSLIEQNAIALRENW